MSTTATGFSPEMEQLQKMTEGIGVGPAPPSPADPAAQGTSHAAPGIPAVPPGVLQRPTLEGTSSTVLTGQDVFTWNEVDYRIGPIVPAIEAKFEQRCERNEAQGIERRRGEITPLFFIQLMQTYLDRLGAKAWTWKGLPCLSARNTIEGEKDLYWFVLEFYNLNPQNPNPSIQHQSQLPTRKMLEEIYDDQMKWAELGTKIWRMTDPNLAAPSPGQEET